MATRARLILNQRQLPSIVQQETLAKRKQTAKRIAVKARGDAPVLTGAFRDGIGVEVSGTVVKVVDEDPLAIHKEFGTSDTPAHATLTNAAEEHGKYSGMRPR